jgi:hypothetical protein
MANLSMTLATIGTQLLEGCVSPVFRSKTIIAAAVLALVAAGNAEAKDWRGIVPLHSTRADVERILGPPTINQIDWAVYHGEKERVSIQYSKGPCTVEFSPWNVAKDTVISIWVTPVSNVRFADLKLDLSKYKKLADYHVGEIKHYIGEEEGVEYQVDENKGTVIVTKYLPTVADAPLRCPEPLNRLSETLKFEYSDVSLKAEKNQLNKFAQLLRRYSSKIFASPEGYILSYAGKRARPREATTRAHRAKNYLVKVWRIDPRRIVTRDAGHREKPTIELYLVPAGGTAPHLTPTIDPKDVQIIKRRRED